MPTLLLADDSATIQRVIELTFANEDIKVIAVSDGDQAIARIEQAPPDIVLADVAMPGKNGYEVAEFVKHTPALAHIPVVLLTGAFEPVDQAKANAAGCDGVLAKPFEPQIVIGRVKELLGKGSTSAAGNPPVAVDKGFAGFASPAAPAQAAEAAPEARVEDYFDRLDAAFANFSSPAPASAAVTGNEFAVADKAAPAPAVADELDWLRPKAAEPQDAPQDFAVADQLAVEPAPEPPPIKLAKFEPEPEPEPEPQAPPAPIAVAPEPAREPEPAPRAIEPRTAEPRALPSIADAFTAILAAEQNALGVRPEWPSPSQQPQAAASSGPSAIVITDELVDRVARRVLEQMSDRVVRETVAQIASDVAERLVREEIERIKASIK
ncbi:MAG TPA: response regulator [Vicinamibacterales bacterium]|nr:response regulator [Vicinamibacterales bacterium]